MKLVRTARQESRYEAWLVRRARAWLRALALALGGADPVLWEPILEDAVRAREQEELELGDITPLAVEVVEQALIAGAAALQSAPRRDADRVPAVNPWADLSDALVLEWSLENAALVRSLDARQAADLGALVTRAVQEGWSTAQLGRELVTALGLTRRRARLIARDQMGKLLAASAMAQQQAAGVTRYIWRAVGDERTRPEHRRRDGQIFYWSSPPPDGHPGEPVLCRCVAEPMLDEDLF